MNESDNQGINQGRAQNNREVGDCTLNCDLRVKEGYYLHLRHWAFDQVDCSLHHTDHWCLAVSHESLIPSEYELTTIRVGLE